LNKNAKLVGEFVLIVVGVLVALAVETALENRKDSQLRDDIELDKLAIDRRIDFFTDVQRFSDDVLRWLGTDRDVDQETLLASYYAAEIWPFLPVRNTYDDLQNTGNIRLLDDIDLRTRLSGYYNKANTSISGWTPSEDYREIIRGVIPNDVQALIRQNCPTTLDFDQEPSGFPPCELPEIDYIEMTGLFAPLKADTDFGRILTYRDSSLGVMIYLLTQQGQIADQLLEVLPPAAP
jgi:hypothetical protein